MVVEFLAMPIIPIRVLCFSVPPVGNLGSIKNEKTQVLKPAADSSSEFISNFNVPTAPWMKGPLLLQSNELQSLPNQPGTTKRLPRRSTEEKRDCSLTGKENGVRGRKTLNKIVRSIDKLKKPKFTDEEDEECVSSEFEGNQKKKTLLPWERKVRGVVPVWRPATVKTMTPLNIDEELLDRLRAEARKMRKWIKVKKAGITQDVVDEINLAWKSSELVMVKFDVPLCRSMARAREILEMKTKGLVIFSKKDVHVIYNASGANSDGNKAAQMNETEHHFQSDVEKSESSLFERETNRLLDGLGPSFANWWMQKPLPVDADMLPETINGFKSPSRLCPPYDHLKLKDEELTYLRQFARSLPTHFVLGRNRGLQGLAEAILKLWKKCVVAKIAIKWGVPNTNNEKMANELKFLTGGTVVLRNKFYIILYRGKDFLVDEVANLIRNRENLLERFHLDEEIARSKAAELLPLAESKTVENSYLGTISEFKWLQTTFSDPRWDSDGIEVVSEIEELKKKLRIEEHTFSTMKRKIESSEKELKNLSLGLKPAEPDPDHEMITEEQRECYRNIGLKMQSSLVLGRRGVFEGVMEGLHQHWKHKEVVKVITMQKSFSQVLETADLLESESGGIMVSIEKLKLGHAIIIYRGKNYRRPTVISSGNLLTKRNALKRSLLLQRIGSLKYHAGQQNNDILDIKRKLELVEKQRPYDEHIL